MKEPHWAHLHYPEINYQAISYYSAPKKKEIKSLDEVDPELLRTFEKLGYFFTGAKTIIRCCGRCCNR